MSQYDAGSKTRMYFGGDTPETPVGVLLFGQNCQFLGALATRLKYLDVLDFDETCQRHDDGGCEFVSDFLMVQFFNNQTKR